MQNYISIIFNVSVCVRIQKRTHLSSDSISTFDEHHRIFDKIQLEKWKYIHLPYATNADQLLFKKPTFNEKLRLRLLYDIMITDETMGGAQYRVDRYISNAKNHLKMFFALNSNGKPTDLIPKPKIEWNEKIDIIRDYYGEMYAFYFAFLVHYNWHLYFPAVLGLIFTIAQLLMQKIAIPGCMVLVIFILIWATVVNEIWYRKENTLKFKWGMTNYANNEITRSTFKGRLVVCQKSGHVIETYASKWRYFMKIIFSMSTIVLCIACVIVIVAGTWILKDVYGANTELKHLYCQIHS